MATKPAAYWRGVEEFAEHVKTAQEVAELANLGVHRVRVLARHRGLGREVGGVYLFTPSEVDQIVNRRDLRRKDGDDGQN